MQSNPRFFRPVCDEPDFKSAESLEAALEAKKAHELGYDYDKMEYRKHTLPSSKAAFKEILDEHKDN